MKHHLLVTLFNSYCRPVIYAISKPLLNYDSATFNKDKLYLITEETLNILNNSTKNPTDIICMTEDNINMLNHSYAFSKEEKDMCYNYNQTVIDDYNSLIDSLCLSTIHLENYVEEVEKTILGTFLKRNIAIIEYVKPDVSIKEDYVLAVTFNMAKNLNNRFKIYAIKKSSFPSEIVFEESQLLISTSEEFYALPLTNENSKDTIYFGRVKENESIADIESELVDLFSGQPESLMERINLVNFSFGFIKNLLTVKQLNTKIDSLILSPQLKSVAMYAVYEELGNDSDTDIIFNFPKYMIK